MTLVLSWLTKDYVIQVSDRRLTFAGGVWDGMVANDDKNKAVIWTGSNGTIAFGYTGLAQLDGEPTDIWLSRVLIDAAKHGQAKLPDIVDHMNDQATGAFERINRWTKFNYPHTFVGIGWGLTEIEGNPATVSPMIFQVTNALDENWKSLPPRNSFASRLYVGQDEQSALKVAGQRIAPHVLTRLNRDLLRVLSNEAGPQSAAILLIRTIQYTAKHNLLVGSKLMVTCLPRKPSEDVLSRGVSSITMKYSSPNTETNSFQYVSGDQTVGYGPHWIFGEKYFGDMKIDAPNGIDPRTGATDFTEGSVQICTQLPDPPKIPK